MVEHAPPEMEPTRLPPRYIVMCFELLDGWLARGDFLDIGTYILDRARGGFDKPPHARSPASD